MKNPISRTALVVGLLALGGTIVASASPPPAAKAPIVNGVRLPARNVLYAQKNVSKWPGRAGLPGGMVVALTVSECTWLGGKVEYWSSCEGTLMKCVGANGHEMCIDTIK